LHAKGKSGAGIYIISPSAQNKIFSFKLNFDCTNNDVEYEALVNGLLLLKYMKAKKVNIFGDSEFIINQVKGTYQTKHSRMRAYMNEVLDILGNFFLEYNLMLISRLKNTITDSLDTTTSGYQPFPFPVSVVEKGTKNRPSIPDNVKHWQVFENDQKIRKFLEMVEEFSATKIEDDNEKNDEGEDDTVIAHFYSLAQNNS